MLTFELLQKTLKVCFEKAHSAVEAKSRDDKLFFLLF